MTTDQKVADALKAILLAINALETLDLEDLVTQQRDLDLEDLVTQQRDLLYDLKNWMGEQKRYQDNRGLRVFDQVFTDCGWDDQGLRWTREDQADDEGNDDIFVVMFTDKRHTKWEIT